MSGFWSNAHSPSPTRSPSRTSWFPCSTFGVGPNRRKPNDSLLPQRIPQIRTHPVRQHLQPPHHPPPPHHLRISGGDIRLLAQIVIEIEQLLPRLDHLVQPWLAVLAEFV